MMVPQEIEDEEYGQVLERVAGVDVAKATGMVCTRVPDPARPGRRLTRVWEVDADTGSVMGLADYLAGERIGKVTLESTTGGSAFTCWKRPGWTCSGSAPGTCRMCRGARRATSWIACGRRS